MYSEYCGFGWRFGCSISNDHQNEPGLNVFFDQGLLSAGYGNLRITVETKTEAGTVTSPGTYTFNHYGYGRDSLGSILRIVIPRAALETPSIVVIASVILSENLGLCLPPPPPSPAKSMPRVLQLLKDSFTGHEMYDTKFYLFTRRSGVGHCEASHAEALYACSSLLTGRSFYLDMCQYLIIISETNELAELMLY